MLKVGVTQEELNGRPRSQADHTHLSILEMQNSEIPQLLVDIATYMQALKDQRSQTRQLELEIGHANLPTAQQVNLLESMYILEKSQI